MSKKQKPTFNLYSRPDCHLCVEMLNAIKQWQNQYDFKIKIYNIDNDADLTLKYAARIPVLAIDNQDICEYFFDKTAFLKHLNN